MDTAVIFAEVTKRNAVRRANGLPSLDVRAEFERQIAIVAQSEYRAICEKHAMEREAIRQEVLGELRAKHGETFGATMGGRWAIGEQVRRRFAALMVQMYGVAPDSTGVTRNIVTYGENLKDATWSISKLSSPSVTR